MTPSTLTRRRLLLQSFAQSDSCAPAVPEQPDVLDRDHGLLRECFKKFDLFISKRANFRCGESE